MEHGTGTGVHAADSLTADGLTVADVSVAYRRDEFVVRGASFEVPRGDVVALLGPSGCGKSTLLRAIAGLEPLASGTVSWGGEDLARVPPHRREFGLVFQDGQLFSHRSVAENIAYGLRVQRMARAERETRVAELLELVGLPGYGARAVTELSGGQRQRVALARALAPSPRLLLLDEPLSALDRELRDRLALDLAELLRGTGTTAILVTHDESEAGTIANRVLRMRDGRIDS
ncbi:ABC transporter ATP-binding protein [Leucobacter sp. G161]|uniref:ABC transporter ATP-binding protein n=1 Tax=Leucobacter sp. G161 TaxID=663704 RepID=UPI00350E8F95